MFGCQQVPEPSPGIEFAISLIISDAYTLQQHQSDYRIGSQYSALNAGMADGANFPGTTDSLDSALTRIHKLGTACPINGLLQQLTGFLNRVGKPWLPGSVEDQIKQNSALFSVSL
jgi:hypothetical protein